MEFYIEKRLIKLHFKKLLYVSIYNHILLNCTYRIDIDSEADMFNEIEAYMVKLAETDCEIKILYKKNTLTLTRIHRVLLIYTQKKNK